MIVAPSEHPYAWSQYCSSIQNGWKFAADRSILLLLWAQNEAFCGQLDNDPSLYSSTYSKEWSLSTQPLVQLHYYGSVLRLEGAGLRDYIIGGHSCLALPLASPICALLSIADRIAFVEQGFSSMACLDKMSHSYWKPETVSPKKKFYTLTFDIS